LTPTQGEKKDKKMSDYTLSLGKRFKNWVKSSLSEKTNTMITISGKGTNGRYLTMQCKGIVGHSGIEKIETEKVAFTTWHTPFGTVSFSVSFH
jgi:hypothetical protein